MSEIYRKEGLPTPDGSMSFQQFINLTSPTKGISLKDCRKALDSVVGKLKKVDHHISAEFTNLGLSRRKHQKMKKLTQAEVHAALTRAHKRVKAVMSQAAKLGYPVRPSVKAL